MNKKKLYIYIITLITALLLSSTLTFAHPGRTDENGGHVDHSTGQYHYHHGFPAHDHTDGICPYAFDDSSISNTAKIHKSSDNNISQENYTVSKTSKNDSFFNDITTISMCLFAFAVIFFGPWLISELFKYIREMINMKKN